MAEDKEFSKQRKYYTDLRLIKSEILKVLDQSDEKKISRAVKVYPIRINHLLMKRNIKSASVLLPFFDLAWLQKRKQDIDLIDLNTPKNDIDLLKDTIRRIDREFEME
jgi:hypothetical protein